MTSAAVALVVGLLAIIFYPLRVGKELDLSPSLHWSEPSAVVEVHPERGPVLVTVRYHVSEENIAGFVKAMSAVRRSRLRTGGHSWGLYRSLDRPDTVLERFTVPSWTEFERQHTERWLESDHDGAAKAVSYTVDDSRRHEYFLAVRVHK